MSKKFFRTSTLFFPMTISLKAPSVYIPLRIFTTGRHLQGPCCSMHSSPVVTAVTDKRVPLETAASVADTV